MELVYNAEDAIADCTEYYYMVLTATDTWNGLARIFPIRQLIYVEERIQPKLHQTVILGGSWLLQLLDLLRWPNLKMLPPSIIKLGQLISFQIHYCRSLECLPDGVQNLLNLERLQMFCPASSIHKNAFRIGQLKSLGQLRRLHIVLKSPNQLEEGELKVLSELQNLHVLRIEIDINNNDESSALVNKLNHQFSPLQDLEELQLIEFPGESTPIWLNPMTFPSLRFLGIFGGKLTHMAPGFWERENAAWKIEVLVLDHLFEFEEESSQFSEAMPSLRKLEAFHCSKLIKGPFLY